MVPNIKKKLLNEVNDFSLGYHPAKLENRGKHPLIWAIILNLKTASTFFKLDKKVDNGDIINQKKLKFLQKIMRYLYIKKWKRFHVNN